MQKKISFVRLSALGDCIMMLPFVRSIQKAFPNAELTWITSKSILPILEGLDGIQYITVPKIKNIPSFLEARTILKNHHFDLLLAMHTSFSANLLYPLISATRKVGFDKKRSRDGHSFFINERIAPLEKKKHLVETYLDFASHLGINEPILNEPIPLKIKELQWLEEIIKEPYYVLHPKSSCKKKDWILSRYIEVAKYIQQKYNLKLFITGAKEDVAICTKIESALTNQVENLAGKTSLLQLSALISKAQFLLTPDTGPAHIGSSFKIPVLGLYGTTCPKIYGPYFSQNFVINKVTEGSMSSITTKEVKKAIDLIISG